MNHRDPLQQLESGPIFIVGAARSGTTWVYDILTSLAEVAGVYESWLFTRDLGVGAFFGPAHWSAGRSGLGHSFDRRAFVEQVRCFVSTVLALKLEPHHRFLVEKSPSHIFTMPLIREILPTARFIHVLRDGRDVSVSVRQAARSWILQWQRTFGRSIYASGCAWKAAVHRARSDASLLGGAFLEVRYEDLKGQPLSTCARLFDFCQIPVDRAIVEKVIAATDFDINYRPSEAGFRRGGRVGDWKSHFSLVDALMFNVAAGDALIETGYEANRRWLPGLGH
jgi:hypothetical protein